MSNRVVPRTVPSALFLPMLGALLWALLAAPGVQAQYHEDSRHGFKLKPPDEFIGIPPTPTDVWAIAKFQSEQTEYGGSQGFNALQPSFEVWFFEKGLTLDDEQEDGEEDEGPGDEFDDFEKNLDKEKKEKQEVADPTAFVWSLISAFLGDHEVVKSKALKFGRDRGEERVIKRAKSPVMLWAATLEQEDGVFLFMGEAFESRFDKFASEYSKAARSFKRIEKDGSLTGFGGYIADQLSDQEAFLATQIAKLPAGWDHLRTDRYLFLFNAEKNFVKELADRIEAMRNVYEEMWPPKRAIEAVSIVRVCATEEEYFGYGAPQGSGGYWLWTARELVFYDADPRSETLAVLNHEAFHQYIFYACGMISPHSWYNEGTGDYFAGAQMTRSHRIQEFGEAPGGYGRRIPVKEACRLRAEGKSLEQGAAAPLKDLLGYTQQQFYARKYIHYPQGWAFIHMLREARGLKPQWEGILDAYFQNLLNARHEVAVETMEQRLELAKKRGDSEEELDGISREPADYYDNVTNDGEKAEEVRSRAYSKTFEGWTDEDWQALDAFYLKYVEKL
jgi:hypothetical protein